MLGKTAELHTRKTTDIASPCESNITKQARHKSQSVLSAQVQPEPDCVASSVTVLQENCCVIEFQAVGGNEAAETNTTHHPEIQLHVSSVRPKLLLLCRPANLLPLSHF